jgi:hypothetical protein
VCYVRPPGVRGVHFEKRTLAKPRSSRLTISGKCHYISPFATENAVTGCGTAAAAHIGEGFDHAARGRGREHLCRVG